ncbi:hypothetical protein SAICODRAFT_212399 [Saitoella complicata NRRL Y-17804]|uniref:Ribosome assembly protein 3 n=1 Tax=Saitoella complicata (strain BCRC 22490 / CBS 7301 / JCM 7358 / NBRC 10748 / NRRL Y-17804) TaxID=698492 RepID=A0A0E9NJL9_SAICN|nr:uncharacterized protein SAICODRAFT_212399 [Saitoella complicata NRRL Y-17804]ODQ54555.1 hypothetical protein SAICODRAFT_212399 [Saitoella complicata NRRL Y-17804]GAO50077.1 hypothetical protein G7K_4212-t1 [Saitoella complicata NRRL Y-17804]
MPPKSRSSLPGPAAKGAQPPRPAGAAAGGQKRKRTRKSRTEVSSDEESSSESESDDDSEGDEEEMKDDEDFMGRHEVDVDEEDERVDRDQGQDEEMKDVGAEEQAQPVRRKQVADDERLNLPAPIATLDDRDPALAERFKDYYMNLVTEEFGDDLNKIREESTFNERSLPMLIRSLQSGTNIFSGEEKELFLREADRTGKAME